MLRMKDTVKRPRSVNPKLVDFNIESAEPTGIPLAVDYVAKLVCPRFSGCFQKEVSGTV